VRLRKLIDKTETEINGNNNIDNIILNPDEDTLLASAL
jgi:hypothetical protein